MASRGAGGLPLDFMAAFAWLLPVNVICELLGVPEADRAAFRPEARKLALALDFGNDPELLATADAAAFWLRDYFTVLVAGRRDAPAGDLISELAGTGGGQGKLSEAELLVNLTLLLFAGFETTTNLLGNGLAILLTRPSVEAGLREGSIGSQAFVTEVLRFDAPVQAATDRWRVEPGQLAGFSMPAGSFVLPLIGAANRDPRRFSDPDTFDPARKDAGALSFGAGAHFCLGAALARMEAELAFPLLLASLPCLALAGDPARRQGLAFRGFDQLPVTVS
jgi:cytochrome P450